MQRSDLSDIEYHSLLERVLPIIMERGLKGTTMDIVAARLGMSKRTLYELFPSKSEMIKEALNAHGKQSHQFISDTFANAENVMVALFEIFKYNRDLMKIVNVEFYKDMDRLYKASRADYEKTRESRNEKMHQIFSLGVEQGMFRPDVDFKIQNNIMALQMEGLKRMEDHFPPEITIQRVFDAIIVGFLRSIASEKGMKILDNLTKELIEKDYYIKE